MSENSVKDILAKFNQGSGPPIGPPPAQKPIKPNKPGSLPVNSANGVRSPTNGVKSPLSRVGIPPTGGLNLDDIAKVKLKKPPCPKPPVDSRPSENPPPSFKLQPKPKLKPVTSPRQESSVPSDTVQSQLKSPPGISPVRNESSLHSGASFTPLRGETSHHSPSPIGTVRNESSLHSSSKPPIITKKPKPPTPVRKDSITEMPPVPRKPSFQSSSTSDDDKENHWKNSISEEEPAPPVSDSENSSASSVTEIPLRRTSFLHTTAAKKVNTGKPMLEPLPPLSVIGNAPRKPGKPPNVSLAKFLPAFPDTPPPPARPPKPGGSPSSAPPSLPARPGAGGLSRVKPTPPTPVSEEQIPDDAGEIYDDVEGEPPAPPPTVNRRSLQRPISLIQTMDSDEEENMPGDFDDIYDDAESAPAPAVPPALPPHPTVMVTGTGLEPAPPLPSISSIPALHGSGGSSISFAPRSAEHSGSGLEEPDVYDDVSAEADQDEIYEALDGDEERTEEVDLAHEREEQRKQEEKRRKEEERLRKEQEKQLKKEEEKRKKKEKEEKKRKEKEEKDMRKKFNIKGDISIIDEGIVLEAMDAEYEKYGLQCQIGEKIEILRKEGNPPGKWLARNPVGHYGYVDHQFVRLEGDDSGEVYDDVIAEEEKEKEKESVEEIPCDEEGEEENIYDAVN